MDPDNRNSSLTATTNGSSPSRGGRLDLALARTSDGLPARNEDDFEEVVFEVCPVGWDSHCPHELRR